MKKILFACLMAFIWMNSQAQFFGIESERLNSVFAALMKIPQDNAVMILQSTMNALSNDTKAYRRAAQLIERFGNPADSIHNEVLYYNGMKILANSLVLSNSERERPKLLLNIARKNNLGNIATDIEYATPDGKSHNLLESDKIKLVFFNDLNCDACSRTKAAMAQSKVLTNMVENGTLQIISIYTGDNQKAWKNADLPAWMVNGWDKKQQVENDEAYVLVTTPLFYLLNSDNTVLIKNEPSLKRIEKVLEVVASNVDIDSKILVKKLFNE